MITIALIGISVSLLAIQLKSVKSEFGTYIIFAGCTIIFFYIVGKISEIISFIQQILNTASVDSQYVSVLIKIAGITYISQFAADVCRDCGYNSISNQVLIFGKITILSLSIPIIEVLMEIVGELI